MGLGVGVGGGCGPGLPLSVRQTVLTLKSIEFMLAGFHLRSDWRRVRVRLGVRVRVRGVVDLVLGCVEHETHEGGAERLGHWEHREGVAHLAWVRVGVGVRGRGRVRVS